MSVHPRSAAASLAPLYTTLQKLPLSPWVISANLYVHGLPELPRCSPRSSSCRYFDSLLLLRALLPHAANQQGCDTHGGDDADQTASSRLID